MEVKTVLLNLAEENTKVIWKQIIRPLAEEKIKASENKLDDILLPFMDQLEMAVFEFVDKIDGEAG